MEIINFILSIVQIIISIITWPIRKLKTIMEINNVKIKQTGNQLENIKGMDVNLGNEEKLKVKNIDIKQRAKIMKNTTGMKISVFGKQEAELENVSVKTPIGSVKISKGVTINKQPNK